MGKSRTVSCGVTAPFSSVLVYRRFVCVLQESVSQSCVSSGSSMTGLMTTSSKRAYAIPRSAVPRALSLQQSTADRTSSRNTQTQLWLSLCGVSGSWWAQGLFELESNPPLSLTTRMEDWTSLGQHKRKPEFPLLLENPAANREKALGSLVITR